MSCCKQTPILSLAKAESPAAFALAKLFDPKQGQIYAPP